MAFIARRIPRAEGAGTFPVVRCNCGAEIHCEEPRDNECDRCGALYSGDGARAYKPRGWTGPLPELQF